MIRLIIAGIIVYVIYRLSRALFTPSERKVSGRASGTPPRIQGEDLVKDPCCGTYVPVTSAYKAVVKGETVYFCSRECLEKYKGEHC